MKSSIKSYRLAVTLAAALLLGISPLFAGDPIHGVDVKLGAKGQVYRAETDASGNFTFRNVPPGEYTLTISEEEFEKAMKVKEKGNRTKCSADFTISLAGGSVTGAVNGQKVAAGVKVTVSANGTMSGRVVRDAASGQATGRRSIEAPRDAASGMATGK